MSRTPLSRCPPPLAATFCLLAIFLQPLAAGEKKIPVLLSRTIDSVWAGDLESSRKYLRTFLSTKPSPQMTLRVRLAGLLLLLENPRADLDNALKLCKSLQGEEGMRDSFGFLYCRGLVYQRLGARSLAEHGGDQVALGRLIEEGAAWRYFKGTAEPPGTWKATAFDASAWLEGKMGLGYGDEDDATELADMQGKYPSVFLRYDFEISPEASHKAESLRLRVRFDDGFIASLNGSELVRVNIPGRRGEAVAHDVTANGQHEASTWEDYIVGAESLVPGRNTLAIQAHNYTVPSSDFSIDATLSLAARQEQPDARTTSFLSGAHQDLTAAAKLAVTGPLQLQVATELVVVELLRGKLAEAEWELLELERAGGDELKKRLTYLRAWIAFRRGRLLEAGRLLARLAPFEPGYSSPGVLYLMGRIHHSLGERWEAAAFYRLVSGSGAGGWVHAAGRLALGAVLIELGEYTEAEKILEEPPAKEPPTTRKLFGRLLHGVALLGAGKLSSARRDFLSVSRAALDRELRSRALFWAGHCSVLSWQKGNSWMRKKLQVAAVDFLDRGLYLEPPPSLRRRIHVELGETLLRFGRFAEAERTWEEFAGGGEEAGMEASYARVVALQGQGKYSQSAVLARDLVKLYPAGPRRGALFQRRGDALFLDGIGALETSVRLGRLEGAVEAYEKALGSPGFASRLTARFRMGTALLLLGEFQKARQVLEKVVKAAAQATDDQVRARTAPAAGFLGQLYLREGEQSSGGALAAAQAAQSLEKAEKYLAEYRMDVNAPSQLRTRAELALGSCRRLRAEFLVDPAEKKKLLAGARAILSTTARRLEHSESAVRASLELSRVEVLEGKIPRAIQRLAVFKTRSPWKDSDTAGEALLELACLQGASGRFSQARATLKNARDLALPGWLTGILLERARLQARTGENGEARVALAKLYHGSYGVRTKGLAALELLRMESSLQAGDRSRKLTREVAALLGTHGDALGAELYADLLLELARLGAAGVKAGSGFDRTKTILGKMRAMLPRDDRRVIVSLLYESGMLLEAGRPGPALSLAEDAYSFSRSEDLEDEALLARGLCLLAGEKVPEALKAFEELAAAARKDKAFDRRLALCLAVACTRAGDPVKAIERFRQAGRSVPPRDGAAVLISEADFRKMAGRIQALSVKPDDNAPDTPVLLARLLLFPVLQPVERFRRWTMENRAAKVRSDFLAEARLLEMTPLPFEPAPRRVTASAERWSELIPLPGAPAQGVTPGPVLGEVVRRVLSGDALEEAGDD